ncbi:hypothetical protein HK105_208926 [Polyrhizophydium stewartii]|uniref:U3 small nucleolar RNA-associated protein 14 n=1 Tax=Polyrhizophydium stewartii TaxID=2732419 RepID=A0ABR4MWE8_9FUNG|nr:hypothetical protein HK105_008261 [Polyrhizophydium stewartii]
MPKRPINKKKPAESRSAVARRRPARAPRETRHDVYEASDEDEDARKLLARRGGGGGAVGRTLDDVGVSEHHADEIDEEDDEEIDEDEAFGVSDEERYGIFFTSKRGGTGAAKTKKRRSGVPDGELDLNEDSDADEDSGQDDDEEEEEEEEGEEYMDISEMLNGDAERDQPPPAKHSDKRSKAADRQHRAADSVSFLLPDMAGSDEDDELRGMGGSGSDSDAQVDDDLMPSDDESGDGDDDDDDNLGKLSSFVQSLAKGKSDEKRKRKRLPEITEAFEESEYGLEAKSSGDAHARKRIGLDDLVGVIGNDDDFGGLKRQLETLDRLGEKQAVSAPAPVRLTERVNRQAAYEQAKKEVSKWTGIVKKNREADQLSFTTSKAPGSNVTSGALVSKFQPATDLEKEIEAMLEQTGMMEKHQRELEELELNKVSKQELQERQRELAKMRALMFFKEQKQKKIAKIKSKTYRKIHKKEAEKQAALSLEQLKELDPDLARAEAEKLELERAKERMTLKHKNTGKWAKQMLGRATDTESRQAISEQLKKHEELKRRIKGLDSDESEAEAQLDLDNDDPDANARAQGLRALDAMHDELDSEGEAASKPAKGLMAMKFMQRGIDRQKEEMRRSIREAQLELECDGEDQSSGDDASGDEEMPGEADPANVQTIGGNAGRKVFSALSKAAGSAASVGDLGGDASDEDEFRMDGTSAGHSVRASGPVTIGVAARTFKRGDAAEAAPAHAKLPKQKQLFEVGSFDVEDQQDTAFVGDANKSRVAERTVQDHGAHANPVSAAYSGKQASASASASAPASTSTKRSRKSKEAVSFEIDTTGEVGDYGQQADGSGDAENPWLANLSGTAVQKSLSGAHTRERSLGKQERALNKMAREIRDARQGDNPNLDTDAQIELEGLADDGPAQPAAARAAPAPEREASAKPAKPAKPIKPAVAIEDSDEDSDEDALLPGGSRAPALVHKLNAKSMAQADLMRMAFANDDVAADFEAEKQREADAGKPSDEPAEVPGWGSWSGPGVKTASAKSAKQKGGKHQQHQQHAKGKIGSGANYHRREDSKLQHVIISDRKLKKVSKYVLPDLPHGFETPEQYDKMMRMPIGREWNTQNTHAKLVAPRVQTKLGAAIQPLTLPSTKHK